MAVELEELIPSLQAEVIPLGSDEFDNVTNAQWLAQLNSAFWEAHLDGIIVGYDNVEGVVTPINGTTDLSRGLQQVIVFYAGIKVVQKQLRETRTLFETAAGPVKFKYEQSATVLKTLLDSLEARRDAWIDRLSQTGEIHGTFISDGTRMRDEAIRDGYVNWWG